MEPSTTAIDSHPFIDKLLARLGQRLREIAIAIKDRQELTRLAECDDRMLADIGINRSDLHEACSQPFWVDPTTVLQQHVKHRRYKVDYFR